MTAETYPAPEHGWSCFHCGEHFPNTLVGQRDAKAHFGATPDQEPGCLIKLSREENVFLRRLRAAEAEILHLRRENEDLDNKVAVSAALEADLATIVGGSGNAHDLRMFIDSLKGKVDAADTWARLAITLATHSQGGHSKTGAEIAELLGIPFPLTMDGLSQAARFRGLDPDQLWPWLKVMRGQRA